MEEVKVTKKATKKATKKSVKKVSPKAEVENIKGEVLSSQDPKLRVKKLDESAKLPVRAHETDAGLDLFALEDFEILPVELKLVKTGVAVAIPEGYVGIVKEKSGLSLKGVEVKAGVIDSSYRGEVCVVMKLAKGAVRNGDVPLSHAKAFKQHTKLSFSKGDKIAQMLVVPVSLCEVEEVDSLEDTDRGEGGFGSTGK